MVIALKVKCDKYARGDKAAAVKIAEESGALYSSSFRFFSTRTTVHTIAASTHAASRIVQ